MTFKDVLEMWWHSDKIQMREISILKKQMQIDKHVLPYFEKMDIESITDITVNQFIEHELESGNRLTGKGLCVNSVIKLLQIVKSVLLYADKKKFIRYDFENLIIKLHKEPAKEYGIYDPEEVDELIKAARPKWMGDLILLMYHTGMRKCECFGLQWSDIDIPGKILHVNCSVTAAKPGDRFITKPKTPSSLRTILLDETTLNMLSRKYANRTSDIWVFSSKYGDLLSPWYSHKYFADAREKVGISGKRLYDMRHTHITDLVVAGVSLPVVQQRAGHSNINMTMHYTHIQPEMQQAAIHYLNSRNT